MTPIVDTANSPSYAALLVRSGSRSAALPLDSVLEIVPACAVTAAPGLPDRIIGVLNYHGTVLPVIDLARYLLQPASHLNPRQCFIICRRGAGQVVILTDEVGEMIQIRLEQQLDVGGSAPAHIRFAIVADEVLPILDLEAINVEHDATLTRMLRSPELLLIQD